MKLFVPRVNQDTPTHYVRITCAHELRANYLRARITCELPGIKFNFKTRQDQNEWVIKKFGVKKTKKTPKKTTVQSRLKNSNGQVRLRGD